MYLYGLWAQETKNCFNVFVLNVVKQVFQRQLLAKCQLYKRLEYLFVYIHLFIYDETFEISSHTLGVNIRRFWWGDLWWNESRNQPADQRHLYIFLQFATKNNFTICAQKIQFLIYICRLTQDTRILCWINNFSFWIYPGVFSRTQLPQKIRTSVPAKKQTNFQTKRADLFVNVSNAQLLYFNKEMSVIQKILLSVDTMWPLWCRTTFFHQKRSI